MFITNFRYIHSNSAVLHIVFNKSYFCVLVSTKKVAGFVREAIILSLDGFFEVISNSVFASTVIAVYNESRIKTVFF